MDHCVGGKKALIVLVPGVWLESGGDVGLLPILGMSACLKTLKSS